jgi:hypothetical protein
MIGLQPRDGVLDVSYGFDVARPERSARIWSAHLWIYTM